jgi:fructose-bisphosphate aldolase class I
MDGFHDIEFSRQSTEAALHATFDALHWQGVDLKGIVLKPNMVLYGYDAELARPTIAERVQQEAEWTLDTLYNCVPASVPGIAFLSGGQHDDDAIDHLKLMNLTCHPWRVTFSYGRALQGKALREWGGNAEHTQAAKNVLLHRAKETYEATMI